MSTASSKGERLLAEGTWTCSGILLFSSSLRCDRLTEKSDGLVSTASTEMRAWFGDINSAYVSFYFKSREKGSLPEPHRPWYPLDTPNCWVGNQNK